MMIQGEFGKCYESGTGYRGNFAGDIAPGKVCACRYRKTYPKHFRNVSSDPEQFLLCVIEYRRPAAVCAWSTASAVFNSLLRYSIVAVFFKRPRTGHGGACGNAPRHSTVNCGRSGAYRGPDPAEYGPVFKKAISINPQGVPNLPSIGSV
jgi:hypothetical protein